MFERFEDPRRANKYLHGSTEKTIDQANAIIAKYLTNGYRLSLRQLYYRLVAANTIPNNDNSYKRLSEVLTRARLLGMVDWDAIEDRVRSVREFDGEFDCPENFAANVSDYYAECIWADQEYHVEFLNEKDAISNVMTRACEKWRTRYLACRGYNSITELYRMGKRLGKILQSGKQVVVFHLGDHDPSGQDMTRDNEARLGMFMGHEAFAFTRLGLNMDQVKELNLLPQPSKKSDSREAGYRAKFGSQSWELDALEPDYISELIDKAVESVVDKELFDAALSKERNNRGELSFAMQNYDRSLDLLIKDRETYERDYAW